jgi:hypothetical protein
MNLPRIRALRTLAFPSAFLLAACGGAKPGDAAAPSAEGTEAAPSEPAARDFGSMLEREVEPLTPAAFASKDGSIKGTMETKQPLRVEPREGFTEVTAPIGSAVPMSCMVYDSDLHVGAALSNVLNHLASQNKARIAQVSVDNVEAFADAAAVYATVLYKTDQKGKEAAGTVKLFFHGSFEHGTMCLHDEVGFRKTFARVTRGFVESLKYPVQLGTTKMVEVVKVLLGDKPVGYSQSLVVEAKNGVTLSVSSSARVLQVAPTEFSTSDSTTILGLDADRRILSGNYTALEGNSETLALTLERGEKGKYHYKGTVRQKPIDGTFTSKDKKGLLSPLAHELEAAEVARAKKSKQFKYEDYSPESDPTKTEPVTASVDGAKGSLQLKLGEIVVNESLADDGFAQKGEIQLGKITLTLQRLVRTGSL